MKEKKKKAKPETFAIKKQNNNKQRRLVFFFFLKKKTKQYLQLRSGLQSAGAVVGVADEVEQVAVGLVLVAALSDLVAPAGE